MGKIPHPRDLPVVDNSKPIIFFGKYLRKKDMKALTSEERSKFCIKMRYWAKQPLHVFKCGSAKPRKWTDKLPGKAPTCLSEEIKDALADYFSIDNKIRVFGYLMGRRFFVLWVSRAHKHAK